MGLSHINFINILRTQLSLSLPLLLWHSMWSSAYKIWDNQFENHHLEASIRRKDDYWKRYNKNKKHTFLEDTVWVHNVSNLYCEAILIYFCPHAQLHLYYSQDCDNALLGISQYHDTWAIKQLRRVVCDSLLSPCVWGAGMGYLPSNMMFCFVLFFPHTSLPCLLQVSLVW